MQHAPRLLAAVRREVEAGWRQPSEAEEGRGERDCQAGEEGSELAFRSRGLPHIALPLRGESTAETSPTSRSCLHEGRARERRESAPTPAPVAPASALVWR